MGWMETETRQGGWREKRQVEGEREDEADGEV